MPVSNKLCHIKPFEAIWRFICFASNSILNKTHAHSPRPCWSCYHKLEDFLWSKLRERLFLCHLRQACYPITHGKAPLFWGRVLLCLEACVKMRMCLCVCVCLHVCACVFVSCRYVCIHIYAYAYAYMYIYITYTVTRISHT